MLPELFVLLSDGNQVSIHPEGGPFARSDAMPPLVVEW